MSLGLQFPELCCVTYRSWKWFPIWFTATQNRLKKLLIVRNRTGEIEAYQYRVSTEFVFRKLSLTWKSIYRIIFLFGAESLLDNDASRHDLFKRKPLANKDIEQKDLCHASYGSEFLAIITKLQYVICILCWVSRASHQNSGFFFKWMWDRRNIQGRFCWTFTVPVTALTRYLGIEIWMYKSWSSFSCGSARFFTAGDIISRVALANRSLIFIWH